MISTVLGGIGLLMYGIETMKDSLEWLTQEQGQKLLSLSGKSTLKAILVGFILTIINQKSSATTVTVVGMVNAGMLSLVQATGVIMGANIGTTVTAQILAFRLEWLSLFIVGIAVMFWRVSDTKTGETLSKALLGLGLMFVGLSFVKDGMLQVAELDVTKQLLNLCEAPGLGICLVIAFAGFLLTAVARSSSLITGIMIGMAMAGIMPIEIAIPLIAGANLGKCVPALQNSRGTSRTARQVAVIHFLFNLFGAFLLLFFFRNLLADALEWVAPNALTHQIAHAHTIFNLGTTVICLPFIGFFAKTSERLVPKDKDAAADQSNLDVRMLETPGLALAQSYNEIIALTRTALGSYQMAFQSIKGQEDKIWDRLQEREESFLKAEKEVEVYLVKLNKKNLREDQKKELNLLLNMLGDVEQVSDTCNNMVSLTIYKKENKIGFSQEATQQLMDYHNRVCELGEALISAMENNDEELVKILNQKEKELDKMAEALRREHVERLSKGICHPGSGVLFVDLISNMERIVAYVQKIGNETVELSGF